MAASPRIYMGRCPKVALKSLVTSSHLLFPFKLRSALSQRDILCDVTIQDFFRPLQKFGARDQNDMSAAAALDAHVAAQLQDFPLLAASGMFLFHLYDVADAELDEFHSESPCLWFLSII